MMRRMRRANRVESDSYIAVGAVLKADGTRKSRGKLAVYLAFGGARADGTPGYQIGEILRRDHVEELAARGHAELIELEQQIAADAQSVVDLKATIEIGIVDESFPANRGARLLKIDAHDD